MTDVAALVVAGLAEAGDATQKTIRTEVLGLARQHLRVGRLQIGSSAVVVSGTRLPAWCLPNASAGADRAAVKLCGNVQR
jgi:hypothetical protein